LDDPAIERLPPEHSLVEAIAALIEGATPLASPEADFDRFNPLVIECISPIIQGVIRCKGRGRAMARGATYLDGPFPSARDVWENHHGIREIRRTTGVTIMLMGKAFRDGGLPFENTERAFRGLFDEGNAKSKKTKVA
jgi:hypothetical protein